MNTRSLPKHSGELKCFINVLGNEFDMIVLTEIGSRNVSTVEQLFEGYVFFYVTPDVNFYGGVGIYIYIYKQKNGKCVYRWTPFDYKIMSLC